MVSPLNLIAAVSLMIFGVGFLLFGIGAVASLGLFIVGMSWAFYVSTVWTLSVYSLHLAEVGAKASSGFMKNSWLLAFIGAMLGFVGILIVSFGGMAGVGLGGMGAAAAAGLIMISIGLLLGVMLPGLAKIIDRDEIGLPGIGMVAEIFGMIFSVLLLISVILLVAGVGATMWVMLIAGICGIGYGVLEAISLFLFPAPSKR